MRQGPAESAFLGNTRTTAAGTRIVVGGLAAGCGLLVVPGDRLLPAAVAVALFLAWSLLLIPLFRHGETRQLPVDVLLLVALCLAQPAIEAPALAAEQCGWVQMVAEVCVVIWTWQYRRRAALGCAAVIIVAYVTGALLSPGAEPRLVLAFAVWLVVVVLASRFIYESLIRVTRRVDRTKAESEREERRIAVAQAVREAQAEHLAVLHDTVAATLLMVGLGGASADPEVLRRQARRDLQVLASADRPTGTDLDLRLREVLAESGLRVSLSGTALPLLPPDTVESFAGAVGEALRNIARHAGTERAAVHVRSEDDLVRVEVVDGGRGFAAGATHGHGIRQSIIGRMERCGGSASVRTSPAGVLVALEWRDPGTVPA